MVIFPTSRSLHISFYPPYVGLTDDLTHFMPFYPITCTEEGEYAALLEIGKIDEWMDKNPGIVQEGKLSFLQEINEESNPVCVIVEP